MVHQLSVFAAVGWMLVAASVVAMSGVQGLNVNSHKYALTTKVLYVTPFNLHICHCTCAGQPIAVWEYGSQGAGTVAPNWGILNNPVQYWPCCLC